jgi:predicted ABC-type ATPase
MRLKTKAFMVNSNANLLDHAGHNGAGKTTFAQEYLPQVTHCDYFINADLSAAPVL